MAHVAALSPQGLPSGKQGIVASLWQLLTGYRECRRIYRELNALSDRELADVGISRHNIADVAKATTYSG
jgi:uncharacterized protein YjiS (DUF1127 family)